LLSPGAVPVAVQPRLWQGPIVAAPLLRFVALYAVMYASFGVSSPFLPRFLESRGLTPQQIGIFFGLGTAVRLLSTPVAGRIADLSGAVRTVLALCMLAATGVGVTLLYAEGFGTFLLVSVAHAAVLAPTTTLADALSVEAAVPRRDYGGFEYGWVRGAASGAFVLGSLVAGQVLATAPLDTIVWMHAWLLGLAGFIVPLVPPLDATARATPEERSPLGGVRLLLRLPAFRRLVVVAALVLGSHAMHDTFSMIRWHVAGISPGAGSALWSESVVAEVLVFVVIGPALLRHVAPHGAMALAALAGVVRWTVVAQTTSLAALALTQPLHGVTFALLHLACMRAVAATVPPHLAATAQAVYAVGATAVTAMFSVLSGILYARLDAGGFLVMAAVCAAALPFCRRPAGAVPAGGG
jgi:PPP family 3-phenylpropionic acid transporter